jgi:hypothetical protein
MNTGVRKIKAKIVLSLTDCCLYPHEHSFYSLPSLANLSSAEKGESLIFQFLYNFPLQILNVNYYGVINCFEATVNFLSLAHCTSVHLPILSYFTVLCRWFRFAQLAKGKKFRP